MRTSRWSDKKGKEEEEEDRGREQRKLREFDAPFLSVDGSVITKAREQPSHWSPAKSDVIVSITGLPRDDRAFLSLFLSPVPHSYDPSSSHLRSPCVPLADSRPMMYKETLGLLRSWTRKCANISAANLENCESSLRMAPFAL